MWSRRRFLKIILAMGISFSAHSGFGANEPSHRINQSSDSAAPTARLPIKRAATVYRAINGTPDQNIVKVVEMMGGIEKLIGLDDIVLIKPNVQWWNQGAPNLAALKTFVGLVIERPGGFRGEVVLAENCHRGPSPWTSVGSGWAHGFDRNSDAPGINHVSDLCNVLKNKYGMKFSIRHLIDIAAGNKRIYGPSDGCGYVYCDGSHGVPLIRCENGAGGAGRRATIMTYPIIRTDRGTVIDFKNGIWEKGSYTGQPVRLINFSGLNHHSTYCGMTSAIKNYMGIADLSGGPDPMNGGRLSEDYFNFHSFPFDEWGPGPKSGMLGAEIAVFMKSIRKADLNITTAEWVGLASRTEPPVAHTRAVMACTDPVALDYHAAKYFLYPNSGVPLHNPDDNKGPLREYLQKCAEHGGGILDEGHVAVKSYDFRKRMFQDDADLVVVGERQWGSDPKSLLKFMLLRSGATTVRLITK
jgi:hypothetical protein